MGVSLTRNSCAASACATFGRVGSFADAKFPRGKPLGRSRPPPPPSAAAPIPLELPLSDSTKGWRLGPALQAALDEHCRRWDRDRLAGRLWRKDAALWTGADEARWLGWLDLAGARIPVDELTRFADGLRADGFTDILLLGMGGSSLGAEVIGEVLGASAGAPALHVLDTTDPAQIARTASGLDLSRTLCVVASKSGTTLEPALLAEYFLERVREAVGPARAGSHFVAVTDPGSALEAMAGTERFRQVWSGRPDVGGRFSVLSNFGLVPAAACGLNVSAFLAPARRMAERCGPAVPAGRNPGVRLGLLLGLAAAAGRDKTTLVLSPAMRALGGWLEQLLAESTGKAGRGLIPIVDEELGPPSVYGTDRLFVHLRVEADPDPEQDAALRALAEAGHPVVTLPVSDREALAGEFFRWELATAACGAVLGVNPFDQPDVEAAKIAARTLTAAWESAGGPPGGRPVAQSHGIALFADPGTAARLRSEAGEAATLEQGVAAHVASAGPGDYLALLAYLDRSEAHQSVLQRIRHTVRDARRVTTSVGFGPRYLHSTGQVFKGGPATGVFLLITADDDADLPVPGRRCTFGETKMAQALGDLEVLAARRRRVVRLHLEGDTAAGLERVASLIRDAVAGRPVAEPGVAPRPAGEPAG